YLAEQNGARIIPMTTVTGLRERAESDGGGFDVDIRKTGKRSKRYRHRLTASKVVLAAGTWGTQKLLHQMRDTGQLPRLSARLGHLTRTNSEAIIGSSRFSVDPARDFSRGIAITSSIHPDENTHLEPVRYGKGSNAMGMLQTLATEGDSEVPRWKQFLAFVARNPVTTARLLHQYRWSERTMILLVMQSMDNSLTTYTKKRFGRRWYTSKQGHGEPNPSFIRAGYQANQLIAEEIGGIAGSTWSELFNIPMTAHFLGGCAIASSADGGVIDAYHRVYGHPDVSVVDGSAVSANLGVNPSLTITAQAERAMSFWPNKGQDDPRPEPGGEYQRIKPVAPRSPAVPAGAPGALRLPIVEVG
ncbi:MAG: FAD-dependent oxidoreductase, partial [Thermocrispum sp.]